jgi:hypothetical protein
MDELFKQLNYRAAIREEGVRTGRRLNLKGPELESHIAKYIEDSFDPSGAAARDEFGNALRSDALQLAREATFTQELINGTFAKKLQEFAQHPGVRLILPFVRTPTNIVGKATRMTPGLQLASKRFRLGITSLDPEVKAQAIGEAVLGAAFWVTAIGAATSGFITGNGPKNRDERAALLATGWQPLSFRMPDGTYISYARIEPLAMLFGMASDLTAMMPTVDQKTQDEVATTFVAALAMNLTNKTYVTGIREVIEVMNDPERRMERFIQNRVGSHVPSFVAQLNDDPYLRELRGYLDGIQARLPGSDRLPPRRDLLGKPLSPVPGMADWSSSQRVLSKTLPIAITKETNNPLREEIAKLRFGFSPPVPRVQGIDLREFVDDKGQDAYDRYQELVGQVGRRSLEESLNRLIASPSYQRLPVPAVEGDANNPRVQAIQRLIRQHRSAALGQLMRERPELRQTIRQFKLASSLGTNPLAAVQ